MEAREVKKICTNRFDNECGLILKLIASTLAAPCHHRITHRSWEVNRTAYNFGKRIIKSSVLMMQMDGVIRWESS